MEVFRQNWRKRVENTSGEFAPKRVIFFWLLEIQQPAASSQQKIQERAKCSTQLMSPSMDRVGILNPTCLRKIPPARFSVRPKTLAKMHCKLRRILLVPATVWTLQTEGGMKLIENVAGVFDQRGFGI